MIIKLSAGVDNLFGRAIKNGRRRWFLRLTKRFPSRPDRDRRPASTNEALSQRGFACGASDEVIHARTKERVADLYAGLALHFHAGLFVAPFQ